MEDNIEEPGVLVGEELLGKYFSITGQEAMRVYIIYLGKVQLTFAFSANAYDPRSHGRVEVEPPQSN